MYNLDSNSPGIPLAKLIGLAHIHKEQLLNEHLAPFGMSAAQFKVLVAIHFNGMNAPVDICKFLNINGGSMTRMIDRLAKKDLLNKQPNPKDKRGVLLNLTETGESLLQACMETIENTVAPLLIGDLSPQEVKQLSALLTRLIG
jgi:MarR family transcriptional regulator, multiple antibiotic resistance protein MarR